MSEIKHYGVFQFKDGVTESDIEECFAEMKGMVGKIPGLLDMNSGAYDSPEGLNEAFTHGFIMSFDSAESRDAYLPHPEHERVKEIVVPRLERVIVLISNFRNQLMNSSHSLIRTFGVVGVILVVSFCSLSPDLLGEDLNKRIQLFDGKSLDGWETKHPEQWRVEDGAIVSGDLKTKVPENYFLFTKKSYVDFEFRCQFRLTGDPATGLINSGIQFRSEHLPNGHARGYQADIGGPEWWGCIYDEHRRNAVIAKSDISKVAPAVKIGDWNEYVIRCEGARSQLWINGVPTVDFIESDPEIARSGKIAVQVHSGGAAKVEFKDLSIVELEFKESPLTPAEQLETFILPDGFNIELVASEESGLPKPITVSFDDSGRMWSITATEYPVDANESPAAAAALWKEGGNDRVVVFDDPLALGPHSPRIFASNLAMPMGLLPWKDGAIVGHGPEILFLNDTDSDGKADSRKVLVNGFGVQDSHLMPHQFTFMPGGEIAMAQGAFNRSQVVAGGRPSVSFDYCKMGSFKPDGSRFETIAYGLNNIWGLLLGREGELFIQEANDIGYSVTPFQIGESFRGIGNQKFKPYAPFAPAPCDFRLGGTGLSGLATSDNRSGGFPAPWHDVILVSNPITRSINAVRASRNEDGTFALERLPDFMRSGDEWFRPIAMTFGPDGCLYIVDWYNKIISHNEVPRNHPDRDKVRGRVWRVRHESQTNRSVPNIAKAPDAKLIDYIQSDSTWAMRAAWRQIVFRNATDLATELASLVTNTSKPADARIHGSWALDGIGKMTREVSSVLLKSANRNLRREGARVCREIVLLASLVEDSDPYVRGEAIRNLSSTQTVNDEVVAALIGFAKPTITSEKARPAYFREFERYLVRVALEQSPQVVAAFLDSQPAQSLPAENRLFASLALPGDEATRRFVRVWHELDRAPSDEELLLLLKGSSDPQLRPIVTGLFSDREKAPQLMNATLRIRDRIRSDQLESVLSPALRDLAEMGESDALVVEMASAFRLASLHGSLTAIIDKINVSLPIRSAAISALGRIGAGDLPQLVALVESDTSNPGLKRAAIVTVGSSGNESATAIAAKAMTHLPAPIREGIYEDLAGTANGASLVLQGIVGGTFDKSELSPAILEKMHTLLPDDSRMKALWESAAETFPRALQLSGKSEQFAATDITLEGAFTVETWVRLEPEINQADGILGRPGGADFNFYDSKFRVYGGPQIGDLVVASNPIVPGVWTHLAVSRSASGEFRIFVNGEPDSDGVKRNTNSYKGLNIGQTTPSDSGTSGHLLDFRIWNRARSENEIRSTFNRSFAGSILRPASLVQHFPNGAPEAVLRGGAKITPTAEAPRLLDEKAAAEEEQQLARFRAIALRGGDASRGEPLFNGLCLACHTVGDKGAKAAPPLDGSGHRDLDSLLRAVVTPDAAVEPGYRTYRVETHDGRLTDGFLVKHDENGATLRMMGGADLVFPQGEIRRARYLNRSFMLPGLFDALEEQQVADLIAHIRTLTEKAPEEKKQFGNQVSSRNIKHSFLLSGPRTAIVDEDNQIIWEVPEGSRDGAVLANGNILVAHPKVAREYDRSGATVWEYKLSSDNGELERATRLAGGITMVVELGKKPQIVEVDAQGNIKAAVPLLPETDNVHMQTRMATKLPDGNYLVPHLLAFAVKEYSPEGKVVRTIRTDLEELGGREEKNWPFTAIPLVNGNVLVNLTNGNKTVEFDPGGKVAWRADNRIRPGIFADPCGGQRLPNGNTVICSYGQRDPEKSRVFEITPDKKIVWEYFNPDVHAHEIHVLTTNGGDVSGAPLR